MRSGEVARRSGVNVETLRFYEREGLLPEPPRRESGYRKYPPETVELIRFIKRAQELGFSLREVQELLSVRNAPRAKSGPVRRLLAAKVVEIERKIQDLQVLKQVLDELLGRCDGRRSASSCPLIRSLCRED
ncbi:MerR family transcriptional regulator [Tautonia sociabilis]|uniref:MerR family transcriptional regulator n=1 Tax=Tautonia sociabilis TaxID=2080755 RepID=A0A432ML78_9BACT|nr:MerR family transcriptional regulator [Tautonia sociabilis]